ncbi:MAG: hypothetical protein LBR64_05950 [Dysgonamonadaceae bacterium]|jgi:hypothetical protein|nr:hypothetical protein [Dysgonamonadaceae bacterium]
MEYNIFENPIFEAVKVSKISLLPFIKSTQYVLKASGKAVEKSTYYFNKSDLNRLISLLSSKEFEGAKPLEIVDTHGNCFIEVVSSDDSRFAAVQIFEFVPFKYTPLNDLYRFEDETAEKFLAFLENSKKARKNSLPH